jgi:hypothetical protein
MKNSNDTIGNQTRDLPACSAVPQPTAPPRAPPAKGCKAYGRRIALAAKGNLLEREFDMPGLHKGKLHAFLGTYRALAKYIPARKLLPIRFIYL